MFDIRSKRSNIRRLVRSMANQSTPVCRILGESPLCQLKIQVNHFYNGLQPAGACSGRGYLRLLPSPDNDASAVPDLDVQVIPSQE